RALWRLERDRGEKQRAAGKAARDHAQLVEVREARLGMVVPIAQQVVVQLADQVDFGADVVLGRGGAGSSGPAQAPQELRQETVSIAGARRRRPMGERVRVPA